MANNNDIPYRLTEIYLTNTFDFKNKTAEEFANEYLETVDKIENVLTENRNSKTNESIRSQYSL